MDIVLATVGLIVSAPILIIVSVGIARVDGLPVLYRQKRVGKDGRLFWIYKLRSMRKDADEILKRDAKLRAEYEKNYKLEHDPRITPIGHFIRKTSIDEFPQFFNVLKGDMSIVGPRPVVPKELEVLYGENASYYVSVKPGCAGLWQCSGRSDTDYDSRIALDIEYVDKASLWFDVSIAARTLVAILARKGAR
jgi:undecaprenyl-phosphate galactose phosphotransferase